MTDRRSRGLIFVAAVAITSIFFINFCATVFRCGCASLWSGADTPCNVHLHGMRHCPWCAYGVVASAVPWLLIVVVQGVISFWPRNLGALLRLAWSIVAFPVVGSVLALIYGWFTGYWS